MNNTLYQYRTFDLPVSWLGMFQQDQKVWTNKDLDFIDPGITLEFIGTDGDQFTLEREDHHPTLALKYVFKVLTHQSDRVDSEIVNHNSHCINALDSKPGVIETTDQQATNHLAHIERYSDHIIASMNNGYEDIWE